MKYNFIRLLLIVGVVAALVPLPITQLTPSALAQPSYPAPLAGYSCSDYQITPNSPILNQPSLIFEDISQLGYVRFVGISDQPGGSVAPNGGFSLSIGESAAPGPGGQPRYTTVYQSGYMVSDYEQSLAIEFVGTWQAIEGPTVYYTTFYYQLCDLVEIVAGCPNEIRLPVATFPSYLQYGLVAGWTVYPVPLQAGALRIGTGVPSSAGANSPVNTSGYAAPSSRQYFMHVPSFGAGFGMRVCQDIADPTSTATATRTSTATATATNPPTATRTSTATLPPGVTPSVTNTPGTLPTNPPTATRTGTATRTSTPGPTNTGTAQPSATAQPGASCTSYTLPAGQSSTSQWVEEDGIVRYVSASPATGVRLNVYVQYGQTYASLQPGETYAWPFGRSYLAFSRGAGAGNYSEAISFQICGVAVATPTSQANTATPVATVVPFNITCLSNYDEIGRFNLARDIVNGPITATPGPTTYLVLANTTYPSNQSSDYLRILVGGSQVTYLDRGDTYVLNPSLVYELQFKSVYADSVGEVLFCEQNLDDLNTPTVTNTGTTGPTSTPIPPDECRDTFGSAWYAGRTYVDGYPFTVQVPSAGGARLLSRSSGSLVLVLSSGLYLGPDTYATLSAGSYNVSYSSGSGNVEVFLCLTGVALTVTPAPTEPPGYDECLATFGGDWYTARTYVEGTNFDIAVPGGGEARLLSRSSGTVQLYVSGPAVAYVEPNSYEYLPPETYTIDVVGAGDLEAFLCLSGTTLGTTATPNPTATPLPNAVLCGSGWSFVFSFYVGLEPSGEFPLSPGQKVVHGSPTGGGVELDFPEPNGNETLNGYTSFYVYPSNGINTVTFVTPDLIAPVNGGVNLLICTSVSNLTATVVAQTAVGTAAASATAFWATQTAQVAQSAAAVDTPLALTASAIFSTQTAAAGQTTTTIANATGTSIARTASAGQTATTIAGSGQATCGSGYQQIGSSYATNTIGDVPEPFFLEFGQRVVYGNSSTVVVSLYLRESLSDPLTNATALGVAGQVNLNVYYQRTSAGSRWVDPRIDTSLGSFFVPLLICELVPTLTITPTDTATSGPEPTNTQTNTATGVPGATNTPTNTPAYLATWTPGPITDDVPVCLAVVTPTAPPIFPTVDLVLIIPTLRTIATAVTTATATPVISVTAIVRIFETAEAGMATPAAAIQTATAQYSWQAGQTTANGWSATITPLLSWLSILNPVNPAYQLEGTALWALAPVLVLLAPMLAVILPVVFFRLFLWFMQRMLQLIDILFKLIELIPGE